MALYRMELYRMELYRMELYRMELLHFTLVAMDSSWMDWTLGHVSMDYGTALNLCA